MAGLADAAIHAVGIIAPSLPLAVRSGRPIARWLTSGSARGAPVCDIPGQKISPKRAADHKGRPARPSGVTRLLAAGTKKMSARRQKRPGDREECPTC